MAYEVDAVVGCSVALCGERRLCSDAFFCNQAFEGGPDGRVDVAETRQAACWTDLWMGSIIPHPLMCVGRRRMSTRVECQVLWSRSFARTRASRPVREVAGRIARASSGSGDLTSRSCLRRW